MVRSKLISRHLSCLLVINICQTLDYAILIIVIFMASKCLMISPCGVT